LHTNQWHIYFTTCIACRPDNFFGWMNQVTDNGNINVCILFHYPIQISYGLSKLLHYLAHSPYGSVILTDFRRQQFVLIDGDLKLTDLDDMGFTEPFCMVDTDCEQYYSTANVTLRWASYYQWNCYVWSCCLNHDF
jgi:hypothetical protein